MTLKILGNRVLVEPRRPEDCKIIIPKSAERAAGGEYFITAIGDGPNIPAALKVGVKVTVTDMGFHPIYDRVREVLMRVYAAEDIIAIIED